MSNKKKIVVMSALVLLLAVTAVFNFVLGDNNAVSRVKRALQKVEIRQAGLFLNAVASAEAVASR